jgi:uncharacterized protein involved in outer membrane biogenesis/outer membrane protein OmpA-like peptidoglycan-associated protein
MPRMTLRLPSCKTLALTLSGVIIACLLFSWQVMPRILQTQAEKYIAEKTGHHLTMDRPQFNPFKISLRLSGLRLTQSDGEPLLAFRELVVDLSAASLFRHALVFDDIRLDGLDATAVLLPDGKLNWAGLIDAFKGKEQTPGSPLPRFDIHRFVLSHARLDFSDRRITPAFVTRVEPIDLELMEISSLPDDMGQYRISARTSFGANLAWHGEVSLEPLAVRGGFSVEHANPASLAAYIQNSSPVVPTRGLASLSADYRLGYASGKLTVNLEHMAAKLTGLELQQRTGPAVSVGAIEASGGSFDLAHNNFALGRIDVSRLSLRRSKDITPNALELGSFAARDIRVNLAARKASVGSIAIKDGRIRATRAADGRIDIVDTLQALSAQQEPATPVLHPWHYRVEKLELAGFGADFRDETVTPAAQLSLENIELGMKGISEDGNAAQGNVIPALPAADIRLKLTELDITPAQPYLFAVAKLKLKGGRLSTEGHASYNTHGVGYQGNFVLQDLNVAEADTGELFLAWKSLSSRSFAATSTSLAIDELTLNGLDTKLIINKDKSVSFKHILRQSAATPASPPAAKSKPFSVNIDRMRFNKGEMDYADYSLFMPFATRIHDLTGTVTNLSSQPGALAQLKLDGQVDDYGLARATGQVDLFHPTSAMNLKVVFRNLEMERLTPYSATFAGRKITSGKLSLDLEYKIKQRQLQGKNQIVMEQLTLGERVESPEAKNLPLDLAIGILQDSNGRIDLGLPMSGNLEDPEFSYSGIIWKAIENVISKIVTAPFRALGALFGEENKFENIIFEAGDAALAPPEREKLVQLADALGKRPALSLTIQGVYAESDRVALQDRMLRRTVAQKSGQPLDNGEDPGPLSMRQPKIQSALENIFSDKLGRAELAAYKAGFRQVNPGKMEESTTDKVVSKLTGLFHENRILSEQELAHIKGADFYTILFERLRDGVVVDQDRLLALATARGEATAAALKAAGAPLGRLSVLPAGKIETEGPDVPIKLILGSNAKAITGHIP